MKNLEYLAVILLAACAVDNPEDGPDDSFLSDGKADTFGITDGSPEGVAVLRVANELSFQDLRSAGVAKRAATNIVAHRVGADGTASTADDNLFDSLGELDAVPYVGKVAFGHLLDYARAHGYVSSSGDPGDAYELPTCTPMTYQELVAHFSLSSATEDGAYGKIEQLGHFTLTSRSRDQCDATLGCTPWRDPWSIQLANGAPYGWPEAPPRSLPASGDMFLKYNTAASKFRLDLRAPEPDDTSYTIEAVCNEIGPGQTADHVSCWMQILYPAVQYNPDLNYPPVVDGAILGFWSATAGDTTMLIVDATICDDGRFRLVSETGADWSRPSPINSAPRLNQISISGSF